MSNDLMVSVSRQQLEHWKKRSLEGRWENVAAMIDMVLVAPAVERQCCAPTALEKELLASGDYTPEELWGGSKPTCHKCINSVERQEPVEALLLSDCVEHLHKVYGGGYFGTDVVMLYTSPPAPVAVVLDERAKFEAWAITSAYLGLGSKEDLLFDNADENGYDHPEVHLAWLGWQARACLDKLKELNQ